MSQTFVQLGSIAEFINGAAFKPEDWGESGMRIIRIQNLTDSNKPFNRTKRTVTDRVRVQQGDLLVSWSATLGIFEWNDSEEALLNQHIFRVLPNEEKVNKRYLRHGLEGAILDMQKHLHGATMQHVNRGEFLSTKLYLPPLEEQKRIAEILDRAEELRSKRREAIAQLDTLTQAIFIEMFGDPATNPKEWTVSKLGDVAEKITDGEHQTPKRTLQGIKLLSARNVQNGYIDVRDVDYVSIEEYQRIMKRCNPVKGDILLSCSGTIGRVTTVDTDELFSLVRSVALLKLKHDLINSKFIEYFLRTPALHAKMQQRANASSQANLFQNQIRELPAFIPPLTLQQEFACRVEAVEKLKTAHCASLSELNALFASLQHRAFRGEL